MPSLHWIGKEDVLNHHDSVEYKLLQYNPSLSVNYDESDNLLVQGDNLYALKSLLPYYEGRIKCIYIDPPYNTGNENWIYNDNVKSPAIQKWLNKTVQRDDLDRHDRWLCMMYPRLELMHQLLADDGAIFISIDDNEQANLQLLLDEIFGKNNFVGSFIINTTPNARDYGHIGKMHEFCFFYAKSQELLTTNLIPDKEKKFKYKDEISGYNIHPLYNSNVAFTPENRRNLYYPFYLYTDKELSDNFYEIGLTPSKHSIEIFPPKSVKDNVQFVWRWGEKKSSQELNKEIIGYKMDEGEYRIVQKMRHSSKLIRSLFLEKDFTSRRGTAEVEEIFQKKTFVFPKPLELVKKFLFTASNQDSIILDAFAGSGTTAHAVMQLNKEDGGNRKYILVEMEETICKNITAERLKRVINGYTINKANGTKEDVEGLGGGFRYCTLGKPLKNESGAINPDVKYEELAKHVFFSATGQPLAKKIKTEYPKLDIHNGVAYYLLYNGVLGDKSVNGGNVLTSIILNKLSKHKGKKIIFGEGCRLSKHRLRMEQIEFKHIPYDIKVR